MKPEVKSKWIDGSELPDENRVTTDLSDPKLLIVLIKGCPQQKLGMYVCLGLRNKEKKVTQTVAYWHILHHVSDATTKIVAWRPCPKIPPEYQEVTGYDKVIARRKPSKA